MKKEIDKFKVILVNPPHLKRIRLVREGRCVQRLNTWTAILPPISLAQCAAILEKIGVDVCIKDCAAEGINIMRLISIIKNYNPDVIVLATATPSIESDLFIASLIKESYPYVKIVAIGIHVSILPEECLRINKGLDFIVRQEPEITLKELIRALQTNGFLGSIDGLSYRIDSYIVNNPDREYIQDLDSLPFPAWSLIDISRYKLPIIGTPFLLVTTSRGCGYNCIFCNARSYYGAKLRLRSVEKIIEEISWIKSKFGIKDFMMWSETFTANNDFVNKLTGEIRKLEINWVCNSRVDTVNFELLQNMKRAGCWMISFGAESGNQQILNNSKKGITLDRTREAILLSKKAGLETVVYCIFGLPGETKKTIHETICFIEELNPTFIQYFPVMLRPGSELYDLIKTRNWTNTAGRSKFDAYSLVLDIKDIKFQQILKIKNKAFIKFYLNPKRWLRILRIIVFLGNANIKWLLITIIRRLSKY